MRHTCPSTLKHYFQHATFDINNSFDQFFVSKPMISKQNTLVHNRTSTLVWRTRGWKRPPPISSPTINTIKSRISNMLFWLIWIFFFKSFRDDRDSSIHTLPVWCSWASCTRTFLSRETTSMNWVHRMTFSAHSCVISVVAVCRRSSSFSKFYNTVKILNHTRVLLILNLIFNFVERKKFNLGWMRPSGFTNTWIIIFSFHHSFLFHT